MTIYKKVKEYNLFYGERDRIAVARAATGKLIHHAKGVVDHYESDFILDYEYIKERLLQSDSVLLYWSYDGWGTVLTDEHHFPSHRTNLYMVRVWDEHSSRRNSSTHDPKWMMTLSAPIEGAP